MKVCFALNYENVLTEGAGLQVADMPFGIASYKSQMAHLKSEIRHLRFLA